MSKHFLFEKLVLLLILSSSLLAFTGCSPKIKIGLWAKKHQDAALALESWIVDNPSDAGTLFAIDCSDRKQFKKKITDALNNTPAAQPAQQGYTMWQGSKIYGSNAPRRGSEDGFANWCRRFPKAAKKLRSHAKALCKTGIGILNGTIKMK